MIRDSLKKIDIKIAGISEEIRSRGGDQEKDLEQTRQRHEEELQKLRCEAESLKAKLKNEEDNRENIRKDKDRLASQDRQAKQARDKRDLIEETLGMLKKLQESYATNVRQALQDEATRIFQQLADETTKLTLSKILIQNDYTLNVINWADRSMLADISAGQRQIVSLAFITSLISITGGKNGYEVPLFMDTPFGRLSADHRDALLTGIPDLASQWIFLATDTEFRESEYNSLLKTGRWKNLYMLEPKGPGETAIVSMKIGEFCPRKAERNNYQ